MNPAEFATAAARRLRCRGPPHAANGPDRISQNVYDAAGQLIEVKDGVGTPLARTEATYTYNATARSTSLTDARGYRAEMTL